MIGCERFDLFFPNIGFVQEQGKYYKFSVSQIQ